MSESKKKDGLHRSIKSRQLTMIAVGGTIGTGIFFASGAAISEVGPAGALFAFGLMAFVVYFMMRGLGEMATELPISGSFEAYANRFIDPALGFAFGWNYWFSWSITVAAEFVAGVIIVKNICIQLDYPMPNGTIVAMCFFVLLMGLNLLSARAFAESEFWFAGLKVITVIIFLVVGVLMFIGVLNGHGVGFENWTLDGLNLGFTGGIGALIGIFLITGFSFQGTELVGLAAAETENPEQNVPRAIKSVFWRMVIFYIGSILVIATLIPYTDPNLLSGSIENVAASPFTLVFQNAGFAAAALFMNVVILTSVLSCGNSGLFCASRMLYAMAVKGSAPKFISKVNGHGVPYWAVIFTGCIAAFSFFIEKIGDGKIYVLLINASGTTGFIIWFGVALTHYRFRKAWIAQGNKVEDLKFRSKFYPFGPIFAMILFTVIIFGANTWAFTAGDNGGISWFDVITSYSFVPVFLLLYGGYKHKFKTKLIPLAECDLTMPEHEK